MGGRTTGRSMQNTGWFLRPIRDDDNDWPCADSCCKGPGGLQGPGSVGHQVCGILSSALVERLADADSHHVLTMMIGGKLHLAPLDKGIQVCQEPTPTLSCRGSTDCASFFPESRRHRNRNRDMGHARQLPSHPSASQYGH